MARTPDGIVYRRHPGLYLRLVPGEGHEDVRPAGPSSCLRRQSGHPGRELPELDGGLLRQCRHGPGSCAHSSGQFADGGIEHPGSLRVGGPLRFSTSVAKSRGGPAQEDETHRRHRYARCHLRPG